MHDDRLDPEPPDPVDPEIRSALESAYGASGKQVNWDALAGRISDAGAFRLAQRAHRGGWQQTAARWARRAVPMAAAASVILALGVAVAPGARDYGATALNDTVMLEEVMAVAASDGLPSDLATASAQDAFLAVMLDGDD